MPHERVFPGKIPFFFIICLFCFYFTLSALFPLPCFGVRADESSTKTFIRSIEQLPTTERLQRDPEKEILNLAEARLRQGLLEDALGYANELVSMAPGNIDAHGIMGTIYAFTGQKEMAQKEFYQKV